MYSHGISFVGDPRACDGFLATLNLKPHANDLGELKCYTVVVFDRNMDLKTLKISQTLFIYKTVKRCGVIMASGVSPQLMSK